MPTSELKVSIKDLNINFRQLALEAANKNAAKRLHELDCDVAFLQINDDDTIRVEGTLNRSGLLSLWTQLVMLELFLKNPAPVSIAV